MMQCFSLYGDVDSGFDYPVPGFSSQIIITLRVHLEVLNRIIRRAEKHSAFRRMKILSK